MEGEVTEINKQDFDFKRGGYSGSRPIHAWLPTLCSNNHAPSVALFTSRE